MFEALSRDYAQCLLYEMSIAADQRLKKCFKVNKYHSKNLLRSQLLNNLILCYALPELLSFENLRHISMSQSYLPYEFTDDPNGITSAWGNIPVRANSICSHAINRSLVETSLSLTRS